MDGLENIEHWLVKDVCFIKKYEIVSFQRKQEDIDQTTWRLFFLVFGDFNSRFLRKTSTWRRLGTGCVTAKRGTRMMILSVLTG